MLATSCGSSEWGLGRDRASVVASVVERFRAGARQRGVGGRSQFAAASLPAAAGARRAAADLPGARAHESRAGSPRRTAGPGPLDDPQGARPPRPLAPAPRAASDVQALRVV